jgi:arsenate reductase (glutaredoxin)
MKATIWHNPDCGTSRKTLAILEATSDIELTVVKYRDVPFEGRKLAQLFAAAGLTSREALRIRGTHAEELGLPGNATDEQILEFMVAHPILVERPFVETEKGVRLCRTRKGL